MILTKEQTAQITNNEGVYEGGLITCQFAYKLLGDQVHPLGSIVCFNSPLYLGPLTIEEAVVFVAELPNTNSFGGVCFQRLYATMIGSLLTVLTGKEYYVEDSCIFCDGLQMSISIVNTVKDSVILHMIFPFIMYNTYDKFGKIELDPQLLLDFKNNAIESFKHLTKSIFIETRRDNF